MIRVLFSARTDGGEPAVIPLPGKSSAHPLCGRRGGRDRAEAESGAGGGDERSVRAGREEDGAIPGLLDPPVRASISLDIQSIWHLIGCSIHLSRIHTHTLHSVCLCFSGRTPAGMSVLGSYLGTMPPLPALVLTHLPSGDEIYQFPTNAPIVAPSVLQWLQKIEDGAESPAGKEEGLLDIKYENVTEEFKHPFKLFFIYQCNRNGIMGYLRFFSFN